MQSPLKQYYYLYKIINLINNKIYIGIHSTNNLNDGYFGGGRAINKATKLYGKENFKKEILEWFDWKCEALQREAEIVNVEFVKNRNTYNMQTGGNQNLILSDESRSLMRISKLGTVLTEEHKRKIGLSNKGRACYTKGVTMPEYTKKKISETMKGRVASSDTKMLMSLAPKGPNVKIACIVDGVEFDNIAKGTEYAMKAHNMSPYKINVAFSDPNNLAFIRKRKFVSPHATKVFIDDIIFDSIRLASFYTKEKYLITQGEMCRRISDNYNGWHLIKEVFGTAS